jgi:integrase
MAGFTFDQVKNAKRNLSLTQETYELLLRRFEEQGRRKEGWVFPAPTQSGHIEESSIGKEHPKALEDAKLEHFELYCFRHTFFTILGASGCDPYKLCRIAGHGDIKMAMPYCHPQMEHVITPFSRLSEVRSSNQTGNQSEIASESRNLDSDANSFPA